MARFGRYEVPGMKIIDEQSAIERDFDHREMKARAWMIGIGLIFLAFVLAFCASSAHAAVAAEWKVHTGEAP
jgi:hypothetical protein